MSNPVGPASIDPTGQPFGLAQTEDSDSATPVNSQVSGPLKILIIAFHYPPSRAIGAVRTGSLVQHLRKSGHSVAVISAADPGIIHATPGVGRPRWWDIRSLRMMSHGHPEPAVPHPDDPDPMPLFETVPHPRWSQAVTHLRATAAWARGALIEIPDPMVGWIPGALAKGRAALAQQTPDIILASCLPVSSLVVAGALSRLSGRPWVADYRDLWTSGTYYPYPAPRRVLDAALERRLLSSATAATTVSEPLARDLRRTADVPVHVVPNGYDEQQTEPPDERRPLSGARLNLLYVGDNFYHGRRSPYLLLDAAASLGLGPDEIQFHFLGSNPHLVAEMCPQRAERLVQVHPTVDRAESMERQSRADALMLLMWNDPGEAGIYSGKLFEYVAVRRPILMFGYPGSVAADLIRSRGLGHVVSTRAEAAQAIRHLLASKRGPELLPDLDPGRRAGLSRAVQNARMERILSAAALSTDSNG